MNTMSPPMPALRNWHPYHPSHTAFIIQTPAQLGLGKSMSKTKADKQGDTSEINRDTSKCVCMTASFTKHVYVNGLTNTHTQKKNHSLG